MCVYMCVQKPMKAKGVHPTSWSRGYSGCGLHKWELNRSSGPLQESNRSELLHHLSS